MYLFFFTQCVLITSYLWIKAHIGTGTYILNALKTYILGLNKNVRKMDIEMPLINVYTYMELVDKIVKQYWIYC